MAETKERQSFSVDIRGLLAALTEQFPEPLLCVRELVQNAADARAQRIEVDAAYDTSRSLFRLAVRDDGLGMNAREVEGYLTIGFSEKDPSKDRGRFGVGKLSPYALGIARMIVETSDGQTTHRITFAHDGSGTIDQFPARPRGTTVRVYKNCDRDEAERLASRLFELVQEKCGSIPIPLFVNGTSVNRDVALPTLYLHRFESPSGKGVLGVLAEPIHLLMGGGIVLETDAPILGPEVSYILDSPRLAPTLSRNAVRRDQAFDALLRGARAEMPAFISEVAGVLRQRTERLRQEGTPIERGLDANDRAALEWLRSLLLDPDPEDLPPDPVVRDAPVLETADGGLVSANELIEVIRRERRVPISRVPRTRDEIAAYADRGVPVLLLYRDLEDFLERQATETVEVDGLDDGLEVSEENWTQGEAALASRPSLGKRALHQRPMLVAGTLAIAASCAFWVLSVTDEVSAPPDRAMDEPWASKVELSSPHEPVDRGGRPNSRRPSTEELLVRPHADEPSDERADPSTNKRADQRGDPGVHQADMTPSGAMSRRGSVTKTLAGLIAVLSGAAGLGLLYATFLRASMRRSGWLRAEAGVPLTVGENRRRRLNVFSRALFHPIDFLVARGWSVRAAGGRATGSPVPIKGYREFLPEPAIRSGVRLDLDRIKIGFVDLVSPSGDPHDGRILVRRGDRVLLNRNYPTVQNLIRVAECDAPRARMLLDVLLATDSELAHGTDPRQVEWDLLSRSELALRKGRT